MIQSSGRVPRIALKGGDLANQGAAAELGSGPTMQAKGGAIQESRDMIERSSRNPEFRLRSNLCLFKSAWARR